MFKVICLVLLLSVFHSSLAQDNTTVATNTTDTNTTVVAPDNTDTNTTSATNTTVVTPGNNDTNTTSATNTTVVTPGNNDTNTTSATNTTVVTPGNNDTNTTSATNTTVIIPGNNETNTTTTTNSTNTTVPNRPYFNDVQAAVASIQSALIAEGNRGVHITPIAQNTTDGWLLDLNSVNLTGNAENEWCIEWVTDNGEDFYLVDDGNGEFTVVGPYGDQDYYFNASGLVPQSDVPLILNDAALDLINYVDNAGGDVNVTLTEAYNQGAAFLAAAIAKNRTA